MDTQLPSRIVHWASLGLGVGLVAALALCLSATAQWDPSPEPVIWWLRFWRLTAAMLSGAALAVGGVLVQGLLRNPLASPSILGTTAGANVGGLASLLTWGCLLDGVIPAGLPAELLLPLGCILGALASLALLLSLTARGASVVMVLITGFILTALLGSIGALGTSIAQARWEVGRAVLAFSLGGVANSGALHTALAAPLVTGALVAGMSWRHHLDLLLAGEEEAAALGLNLQRTRTWIIIWTAVVTAAAVAIGGNIGFVGLIVPHALRPWFGALHGRLLPAAAVAGAGFVALCDVLTRFGPLGSPIPLGVVTGLVGAPVFLTLLRRSTRQGGLA